MLKRSKLFSSILAYSRQTFFSEFEHQRLSSYNSSRSFHQFSIFQQYFAPGIGTFSSFTSCHNNDRQLFRTSNYPGFVNTLAPSSSVYLPFSSQHLVRFCSNAAPEPEKKPSLFQRFKQMYKEYGYILVPVHLVTSAFWFSSFYYLTKSGVDIAGILESIGAGEKLVDKMRNANSTMGYVAISYALYKIATPVRYTVTLGGTTLTIKYLRDWGYIKPIPPKDKLKEIIVDKKDMFMVKKENLKHRLGKKRLIKKEVPMKIGLKKG